MFTTVFIGNKETQMLNGCLSDTEGIPRCVKYGYLENDRRAPTGGILQPGKIEAWVSVASEYGEELCRRSFTESGNAGTRFEPQYCPRKEKIEKRFRHPQ